MERLVCPDCGCEDFLQTSTQVIQETGYVHSVYGFEARHGFEEVLDHEADDDGDVQCEDCRWSFEISELVTIEEYNESEDDDDA